jgi:methyl-accepting chemotaxis protein
VIRERREKMRRKNINLQMKLLVVGIVVSMIPFLIVPVAIYQPGNKIILGAVMVTLVLTGFVWLFIAHTITKPIRHAATALNECAAQIASASSQVSSASQSLAEGASESAASLEEISVSLNEMDAMTKLNAENASRANELTKETKQTVSQAQEAMGSLVASMAEIANTSAKTSEIVKMINDIAFQTNLLALNAAVEAAHAGEAGAGFTIVANEVRDLSKRSAEAAKRTAEMIEATIFRIQDGKDLAIKTNHGFLEVTKRAAKMSELIEEIAMASKEQSQGISQVNTTLGEIDKVVQANAANTEEVASTSEEMSAQAEQMKEYVAVLSEVVNGARNAEGGTDRHSMPKSSTAPQLKGDHFKIRLVPPKKEGEARASNIKIPKPNRAIPLEEADFKDF